jgi:RNA polymerase sigma factor for flagellar operon FliA
MPKSRIIPFPVSEDVRNDRIETHMHLVPPLAKRIRRRLPPTFELDDLKSAGYLGLLHAAETYKPTTQVPFHVYARYKIRGAILDSVRRRAYRNGKEELPGAAPYCAKEIAIKRNEEFSSERVVANTDNSRAVSGAIEELPADERTVLVMHYEDRLSIAEVADQMQITPCQASRFHLKALGHCREHFRRRGRRAA